MKKREWLATALAVVMAFGLFACNNADASSDGNGESSSESSSFGLEESTDSDIEGGDSSFESASGDDDATEEIYDDILIVERSVGEADALSALLSARDYNIVVKCIADEGFPASIEALCSYDQIILNNIADRDMPEGFDTLLQSYVYDFGGGLFTVGGNDENGEQNAYVREDMRGTLYQQLLPVEAIDYAPPVGVVLIMDTSGSMATTDNEGQTGLEKMKKGVLSSLDAFTERDYVGIVTMSSPEQVVLPMTPCTQETMITEAIESLEAEGGTILNESVQYAGRMLRALDGVAKRHIVVFTDGLPADPSEMYNATIERLYKNDGITLSVVGIGVADGTREYQTMKDMTDLGQGNLHITSSEETIVQAFRTELDSPELKEYVMEAFYPTACDPTSPLLAGIALEGNKCTVALNGFYGTKVKEGAKLVLTGEYGVPIYAQWKYGKGSVGSFACDLNGTWSSAFMVDKNGVKFIYNIIDGLFPTEKQQ